MQSRTDIAVGLALATAAFVSIPVTGIGTAKAQPVARRQVEPGRRAIPPRTFIGFGIGGHRISGDKHRVGNNILNATGASIAVQAFAGLCGIYTFLCVEANIASGASGSSSAGANTLTRRKSVVLGFDFSVPISVPNLPFFVRPIAGLDLDLIKTELGGNSATNWMPTWHVGFAIGAPIPGTGMWGEVVYRHSQTFGTQNLVFDRIGHTNQSLMYRVSVPLGSSAPFGSGATAYSDTRLKRDVVKLAKLDGGIDLYRYRYLWSDTEYVGVMAQETAEVVPEAVTRGADGWLRVDYGKLGTRLMTWDEWRGPTLTEIASVVP